MPCPFHLPANWPPADEPISQTGFPEAKWLRHMFNTDTSHSLQKRESSSWHVPYMPFIMWVPLGCGQSLLWICCFESLPGALGWPGKQQFHSLFPSGKGLHWPPQRSWPVGHLVCSSLSSPHQGKGRTIALSAHTALPTYAIQKASSHLFFFFKLIYGFGLPSSSLTQTIQYHCYPSLCLNQ